MLREVGFKDIEIGAAVDTFGTIIRLRAADDQ
jgi:hypothetical protein